MAVIEGDGVIVRPGTTILHVTTGLGRGGAERMIASLAKAWGGMRELRMIVAYLTGDGELAEEIRDTGVEVVCLGAGRRPDIRPVVRLGELIRKNRVQLVHTHLLHAGILGRLTARALRVPVVVTTQHNTVYWEARNDALRWLSRMTLPLADRIIAVGRCVRDGLIVFGGVSPERIEVIPNGVDPEAWRSCAEENRAERAGHASDARSRSARPVIVSVGNLLEVKGHGDALEAVELLRRRFGAIELLLVGDGPERSRIERRIRERSLGDNVRLLGSRADVRGVLGEADLFLLPSHEEGISIALLEAMAAGLPVVATRAGGNSEIVEDGVTGILVPRSEPDRMARAMESFFLNPGAAKAAGEAGRRRVVERFAAGRCAERTLGLYERLLVARGRWSAERTTHRNS